MTFTEAQLEATHPISMVQEAGRGWHSRGYLPHFDAGGIYQSITYRLGDSLPGHVVRASTSSTRDNKKGRRIGQRRGTGYGSCILRIPKVAKLVVDAWKYFDAKRYDLVAYVVMPNHVHVLIKTYAGFPLSEVVHSWKSFTAHEIIKRLKEGCGRDARGPSGGGWGDGGGARVWQSDYFDRFIRDERHFRRTITYIHENPVKAGLCRHANDWPWSSAKEARED